MLRNLRKLVKVVRFNTKHHWGTFWNYRHGFFPDTVKFCGITHNNYKQFLSDRKYYLGHPYNGPYSGIIDNKLWLPLFLKDYPEYCPQYFYFKDDCGFLWLGEKGKGKRDGIEGFFELLQKERILALKHTHSSIGKGFILVKQEGNKYYLNGKEASYEEISHCINSLNQYIITEYIRQHSYSSEICSTSLNTVRFVCVRDFKDGKFFLARSFHRFGCNGNIVDNLGSGNGICVYVDVNTGKIKDFGAINVDNSGDKQLKEIIHPDSGVQLVGLQIPGYLQIKDILLEISDANSYLKLIGYDVAITEDSFKIIEVNSCPTLEFFQQQEGLLTDERMRAVFLEKKKYEKK